MSRLNLNIPDDLHDAFRAALKGMDGDSQSKFLRRCMRACADGQLWFENQHPRTRTEGDVRFAPVIKAPEPTSPTVKPISVDQYREFVNNWRMSDSGDPMDKAQEDGIVGDWIRSYVTDNGYDEKSLREYIISYPPMLTSIHRKKTDKFLGLDSSWFDPSAKAR